MRRTVLLALLVLAAAPAAVEARVYVGGTVGSAGGSLIMADSRGDRVVLASAVRCGQRGSIFRDAVRGAVGEDAVTARGRGVIGFERGRIRYRWEIETKRARGVVIIRSRFRGKACDTSRIPVTIGPAARPSSTKTAAPPAGSAFAGLASQPTGPPLALVLEVDAQDRVLALWPTRVPCDSGSDVLFQNLTPRTRVREGRFDRRERFTVDYADDIEHHHRVRFAGRFTEDGATGVLQVSIRVTQRGRYLGRCAAPPQRWYASMRG